MYCIQCGEVMTGRRRKYCARPCGDAAYYRRKTQGPTALPQAPVLHQGRFQAYQDRYGVLIDVIITDPPYGRKNLPIYEALATCAETVLKPGGWLLCLTGGEEVWEVKRHWDGLPLLQYVRLLTYVMHGLGNKGVVRTATGGREYFRSTKAVLFYERQGAKQDRRKGSFSDLIEVPKPSKQEMAQDTFKWQQNLLGFEKIVHEFTNPGDVILDPMMGSGTTLVAACRQHRRRVIGIEQDAATFALAHDRLTQAGLVPAAAYRKAPRRSIR